MKTALEPEIEAPEVEELDTPFRRRTALAVALLALFGGIVLFASGVAGGNEEATSASAQRQSVIAMTRSSAVSVEYNEQLQSYLGVSSLRHRANITQTWDDLLGLTAQGDLAKGWDSAASDLANSSDLAGGGKYANNPALLAADMETGPDLATLRQQGADETAAAWGQMRRLELGVVTLVAVALSLLGLSLTVSPGIRRYLVAPAVLIVIVSVAGFAWVATRPVPHTSAAAMNAVVQGDRLAQLKEFPGAIRAYDRALAAQPGYPAALEQLAVAVVQAGAPPQTTGQYLMSMSTPTAYRAAISDLTRTLGGTGNDYVPLVNLGAFYFHVRDYAESAAMSQRAIQLNPGPPLPWMNLGLALLGEGNAPAAAQTYRHAITLIVRYPNPGYRKELFSAALTTLQALVAQEPGRAALIQRTKAAIVAAESKTLIPRAVPAGHATISGLKVQASWPSLNLSFSYANVPNGARLAAIVYFRPPGQSSWLQPNGLDYFSKMDLASSGSAAWRLVDQSCPAAGDYRVEIYNDGHLLAAVTAAAPRPPVSTVLYEDPFDAVTLCRPASWTVTAPGPIDLTAPGHRTSMSVQVVPMPQEPPKTTVGAVVREVLERMVTVVSGRAAPLTEHSWTVGGQAGFGTYVSLPGGEQGLVWAYVSRGGFVHAVELKYPAGQLGLLTTVMTNMQFNE